jgi:hypothetical protein
MELDELVREDEKNLFIMYMDPKTKITDIVYKNINDFVIETGSMFTAFYVLIYLISYYFRENDWIKS